MLRPAIAAGAAIVAMETLTDFATVQYFNQETITVGVFRIWRGTYDRDAASEIATLVLVFALFAIGLERILRGRRPVRRVGRRREPRSSRSACAGGAPPRATAGATLVVVAGVPRPRRSPRDLGDRRAAQPAGHADGRALPRVPRQQPHARGRHGRRSASSSSAIVANAHRFTPARVVGVASRVSIVGYAVPGPGGRRWGSCSPSSPSTTCSTACGSGLPGFAATGFVHRPRLRLRDPLPRARAHVGRGGHGPGATSR